MRNVCPMDLPVLSEFERELFESCSVSPNMGETTTTWCGLGFVDRRQRDCRVYGRCQGIPEPSSGRVPG